MGLIFIIFVKESTKIVSSIRLRVLGSKRLSFGSKTSKHYIQAFAGTDKQYISFFIGFDVLILDITEDKIDRVRQTNHMFTTC